MQALKNLTKIAPVARTTVQTVRPMSVISTPPRVKIPLAEQIIMASIMVVSWTAIPVYVLVNIRSYRDK